jgi:hypothetical protein
MMTKICLTVATLLGFGAIANGLIMLAAPMDWYFAVPGVTDTGPFNQHFLRDIGVIYVFIGIAMLAGVLRPAARTTLWGAAAAWQIGHALFHIWEVAVGICGPNALARDFADVTLPAVVTLLLAIWSAADRRSLRGRPAAA